MSAVVVLGAGVNGLVAANLLAKAGHKVILTDTASGIGGAARSDSISAGYVAPGILDRTEKFSVAVESALALGEFAREASRQVLSVDADGEGGYCPDGRGTETVGLDSNDTAAWQQHGELHSRLARVLRPLMESVPPSPLGQSSVGLRWLWNIAMGYKGLSTDERELLLRVPPAPLADWLHERFQTPYLKASLAWSGLEGTFAAPASPGTAAVRMFHDVLDTGRVVGGVFRLLELLEGGCQSRGVSIRTGLPHKVHVMNGRVHAVDIGGERHKVSAVLSTIDPVATLLEGLEGGQLTPSLERSLRNVRRRGTTVRIDFALDRLFTLSDERRCERIRVAGNLMDIERAFDACKYDELPEQPWLEIRVPSAAPDGSVYAPDGCDIVSVLVRYVSTGAINKPGAVQLLRNRILEQLDRLCPNTSKGVLVERFQDHDALECEYGLAAGNLSHVEPGLDQLLSLRPVAECGRYATPVEGLFIGGMGCHPGGGLTGIPGWLGAQTLLKHLASG